MNTSSAELRSSANQSKFIQDRISKVEEHFGELCTNIAAFNRKLGKLRDRGDEVAGSVHKYAENESHNPTTQAALLQFSANFAAVQDYRDAEVRRMEDKVIAPLTEYGDACKHAKERLKHAFATRTKELKQKKTLDKVRDKSPGNKRQITQAETDLQLASCDASRSSLTLEQEMDKFEKKKLQDIKSTLLEFVNIELMFHAKALEMYTQCYQGLTFINEDLDIEEFRNSLRPRRGSLSSRLEMQRSVSKTSLNSQMNTTLNTTQQSPVHTPQPGRSSLRSQHRPASQTDTLNSTQYSESTTTRDDDSDSEDDDDEDDDDDDDDDTTEYERNFRK